MKISFSRLFCHGGFFVTADLQSAVNTPCGFIIRNAHVDDSDYKSEQRITPDCKSGVTGGIGCRGVSHTPENVHVDKLVHPGVCDTPLHWLFADIQLK